jgi:hypothetical protein
MGQLQMNNWANLLRSLDSEDLNDESSFDEDMVEYEERAKDDPQ